MRQRCSPVNRPIEIANVTSPRRLVRGPPMIRRRQTVFFCANTPPSPAAASAYGSRVRGTELAGVKRHATITAVDLDA